MKNLKRTPGMEKLEGEGVGVEGYEVEHLEKRFHIGIIILCGQ